MAQTRISPITGNRQFLNENNRWQNENHSAHSTMSRGVSHSPKDDLVHDRPVVSIFSDDFTQVLYDRYGDDPREVDGYRIELQRKVDEASSLYHTQFDALNNLKKFKDVYNTPRHNRLIEEAEQELKNLAQKLNVASAGLSFYNEDNPVQWPQYWLVSGGHFHNDRNCHTLRDTTSVGMYPDASGMTEAEAIELAGSRVCTHCVPNAPSDIESRPSHVWTEEEKEDKERKQQREQQRIQEKEEKDRRKKEKENKAKQKVEEKKQSGDHFLDEPRVVPSLYTAEKELDNDPVDNVDDVKKKIKSGLNDIMVFSAVKKINEDKQTGIEHRINILEMSYGGLSEDKKKNIAHVLDTYWGTDKQWATEGCYGDLESLKKSHQSVHDAVQVCADTQGKTFDKSLNEMFSKRTFNTVSKNMDKMSTMGDVYEDNYRDLAQSRMETIKGWVADPDSIDSFFNQH